MAPSDLERLREQVMRLWDPIGVHDPKATHADRQCYWNEYDDYLPAIVEYLDDGADEGPLAEYLARVRVDKIGLPADPGFDRAAARALRQWYVSHLRVLRDRAAAVAWARSEARRIVCGDYDGELLGVFHAAQRMELRLCRWQWLDDDYPAAVRPFVEGWNTSGPDVDYAIRQAAHELVSDQSGNGAPIPARYELD